MRRLAAVICAAALLAASCSGGDEVMGTQLVGPSSLVTASGNQRIIAEGQSGDSESCDGPCPSTVTVHDASGVQLSSLAFQGSIEFAPALDYPGRAILWERLPGTKSTVHLLNTATATTTRLFDFEGFPQLGWDRQVHRGSKWFVVRLIDTNEVILVDLDDGKTRTFPAAAPHMSLRELQRAFALAANDGQFAVAYERGVIEVYNTETFAVTATASYDPAAESLGSLSPDGTNLVIRSGQGGAHGARIIDLASGVEQRFDTMGIPVGWFSANELLVVGEGRARLLDVPAGTFGESYPSLYANFEHISPSLPWHISAMGERILLTHIETGEVVEGAGVAAMFDTAPSLQGDVTWVLSDWANPSAGFELAMLDLRSGRIETYSEPDFEVSVRWEYALSADRSRVLIPGFAGPGRLLSNGLITPTAKGLPSFCDDGTYVLSAQDRPPFDDEREAALFGGSIDAIATFGPRPQVQCVG